MISPGYINLICGNKKHATIDELVIYLSDDSNVSLTSKAFKATVLYFRHQLDSYELYNEYLALIEKIRAALAATDGLSEADRATCIYLSGILSVPYIDGNSNEVYFKIKNNINSYMDGYVKFSRDYKKLRDLYADDPALEIISMPFSRMMTEMHFVFESLAEETLMNDMDLINFGILNG